MPHLGILITTRMLCPSPNATGASVAKYSEVPVPFLVKVQDIEKRA